MRITTFLRDAGPRAGLVLDGHVVDLGLAAATMGKERQSALGGHVLPDETERLLRQADGLARAAEVAEWARERAAAGRADPFLHRLEDVTLKTPLMRPEKVLGIGLNYRDHCKEMGRELPSEMRVFAMFANALIGSGEEIILPKTSLKMDWEAELVAVIGSPAKHVPAERAMDYVAGFTIGNDVSARDHQQADPMVIRGKSGDTHAPVGPWIVTCDEIEDPHALGIELKLNGTTKQSSNTSEIIFAVEEIVAFLSYYFTLAPGDLIFTGTPAGVGAGRNPPEWLKAGDRVDVTIEKIGTLSNVCVAESD